MEGKKSLWTTESSASENKLESVSNPVHTVSTDAPPAETPNNQNIEPRRSRRIKGQATEGHSKEHWSLSGALYEEKVDAEDDYLVDNIVELIL